MVTQTPTVKLATGQSMPMLGLGTWQTDKGKIQMDKAVELALSKGIRLIDGAYVYENEKEVGQGLKKAINDGICKREDVFLVSKLWNTFHRVEMVEKGCRETLDALDINELDLYLMHWPIAMVPNEGIWPKDGDKCKLDKDAADFVDTWKAMEKLVEKGMTKSIGLSNVNKQQLQRVLKEGKIRPAVIQNEVHPFCYDRDLLDFCKKENIVVMAYSPLAHGDKDLLGNATLKEIANKEGLTVAQVLLLWNLSEGRVVFPKSTTPERIEENFGFLSKMQKLPREEVDQITKLTKGKQNRTCDPEKFFNVKIF